MLQETVQRADRPRHTDYIQNQIDFCHGEGGGEVRIPGGIYVCGTLFLRSGVRLHLEKGAVIRGSRNEEDYPPIRAIDGDTAPGDLRCLIHADGVEDVALTGEGVVDGGFPEALPQESLPYDGFRPRLCFFRDTRRLEISGLNLTHAGFWTLHLLRCEDVLVERILIRNPYDRVNTDGIGPDSCRRVKIRQCVVETGDDCIVMKSTCNQPCEDIEISHCELRTWHGAIKVGTESLAPIRRIMVSDCRIPDMGVPKGPALAIGVYMKDGGLYEDFTFRRIYVAGHDEFAVMVDNRPRWPDKVSRAGAIRHLNFSELNIHGGGRILIEGRQHALIQDLVLKSIRCCLNTADISTIKPRGAARMQEDPGLPLYLEARHHVIIANATGVRIDGLEIKGSLEETASDRGILALFNVNEAQLSRIAGDHCSGKVSEILMDVIDETGNRGYERS